MDLSRPGSPSALLQRLKRRVRRARQSACVRNLADALRHPGDRLCEWRALAQNRRYAALVRHLEGTADGPRVGEVGLRLGVVGGCPISTYLRLGYDWKSVYYNPLLLFEEVHYFQWEEPLTLVLDFGYPFYVHAYRSSEDIVRVCRACHISVLRAYDAPNGRKAIVAGRALSIPTILSIH